MGLIKRGGQTIYSNPDYIAVCHYLKRQNVAIWLLAVESVTSHFLFKGEVLRRAFPLEILISLLEMTNHPFYSPLSGYNPKLHATKPYTV